MLTIGSITDAKKKTNKENYSRSDIRFSRRWGDCVPTITKWQPCPGGTITEGQGRGDCLRGSRYGGGGSDRTEKAISNTAKSMGSIPCDMGSCGRQVKINKSRINRYNYTI